MKKLEELPKKDFLSAPDGYFDSLPGRIQARIEKPAQLVDKPAFLYSLHYVLPVVALIAVGVLWFTQPQELTAEKMLAAVETDELVTYLVEIDFSAYEELAEENELDEADANALEQAVYDLQWQDESLEDYLNEVDINTL